MSRKSKAAEDQSTESQQEATSTEAQQSANGESGKKKPVYAQYMIVGTNKADGKREELHIARNVYRAQKWWAMVGDLMMRNYSTIRVYRLTDHTHKVISTLMQEGK